MWALFHCKKRKKEKETDNYEIKKKKKRIPLDFTVCTCLLISPIYSRSTHIGLIKPVNRLLILPIYNTRFLSTVVTLYHLIFTNWLKNHFFLVIAELCSCPSLQVMPFFCWLWHTVDWSGLLYNRGWWMGGFDLGLVSESENLFSDVTERRKDEQLWRQQSWWASRERYRAGADFLDYYQYCIIVYRV